MKKIAYFLVFLFLAGWSSVVMAASSTAKKYAGQLVYRTDKPTEFWLVDCQTGKRSLLENNYDYKKILALYKSKFVGISEVNFSKIAASETSAANDKALAKRLAGKIILRAQHHGEAWYVNPSDLKRYDLNSAAKLSANLKFLATKITPTELASIHKTSLQESLDQYSSYEYTKVKTDKGTFTADIVKIDLSNPKLKIITDTADSATCKKNCHAKSLMDYIIPAHAFAGINGTYFCSGSGCGARNYYFFPVYNSQKKVFINDDQLKYWTTGPVMAFDTNNKFYYFKYSYDFKSVANFEKTYGVKLQAAIGNKPRLVENGMNVLIDWEVDPGQLKGKYWRNALGYKDNGTNGHGVVYLVIVKSATLDDLGSVIKQLGLDYAINLDGGSSAALFYNDEYMEGPGRDIPNVIMFAQ